MNWLFEITVQVCSFRGGYFRLLSLLWKISCINAIIATIRILYWIKSDQVTYSISLTPFWEPESTAYRFRYALGFLLYHTTRKMSNHSFRCFCKNKYGFLAVAEQKQTWQTSKKCIRKKSLPVQQTICSHAKGSALKQKNAGQCRRFLLSGKESCCRTVCF